MRSEIIFDVFVMNGEVLMAQHLLLSEGENSDNVHTGVPKELDGLTLAVEYLVELTEADFKG